MTRQRTIRVNNRAFAEKIQIIITAAREEIRAKELKLSKNTELTKSELSSAHAAGKELSVLLNIMRVHIESFEDLPDNSELSELLRGQAIACLANLQVRVSDFCDEFVHTDD